MATYLRPTGDLLVTGHTAADGSGDDLTDLKFVGEATADAMAAAEYTPEDVRTKTVSYRMLVDAGVNPGVAAKIRRWHSLSWSFDSGDDLDRRSEQVRGLEDDERAWVAASYDGADAGDDDQGDDAGEDDADDPERAEASWVAAARQGSTADGVASEADASDDDGAAVGHDATDPTDGEAAWVAESTAGTEADGSGDPVAAEAAWRERSKPTPLTTIEGIGEAYADRLAEAGVTSVRSLATADPELLSAVTGIEEGRIRTWYERATDADE